jgi:15-cis-phytoene synthase/lycopene beta-cyclase
MRYGEVLLVFVVPPTAALAVLARPALHRVDLARLALLVSLAVAYTTGWDSNVIAKGAWQYCEECVVGTLWRVPLEEYCFFVLQTLLVGLWTLLLTKPRLPALNLARPRAAPALWLGATWVPCVAMLLLAAWSFARLAVPGTPHYYLGSILWWALPVLALQWAVAGHFVLGMGARRVALCVLPPTLYLWVLDTWAMGRGVWRIVNSVGELWPGLPVEEALFFFISSLMVVLGHIAFDSVLCLAQNARRSALATAQGGDALAPTPSCSLRGAAHVLRLLQLGPDDVNEQLVEDLVAASALLERGSKSFALASVLYPTRVRQAVTELYSWCRVADDLVDEAPPCARPGNLLALRRFVAELFASTNGAGFSVSCAQTCGLALSNEQSAAFRCMARVVRRCAIPRGDVEMLLEGFAWDVEGREVVDEKDLLTYARGVAASVGRMLCRIFGVHDAATLECAEAMGVALQLTNIARDVLEDAARGRVYVPTSWFRSPQERNSVLRCPHEHMALVQALARRCVLFAEPFYARAVEGVARLPEESELRGAVRAGLFIYREIGLQILDSAEYPRRATVPLLRKLAVVLGFAGGGGDPSWAAQAEGTDPAAQTATTMSAGKQLSSRARTQTRALPETA